MVGYEAQEQRQYYTNQQGRGFSISPLLYLQYASSTATPFATQGAISEATFLSYFGLLIDSAINNLKRFTEIQFLPLPYTVISYRQDELIIVNDYQNLPLQHLLDLWKALNQQIVLVVQRIPPDKLKYNVDPQYESREMKTLEWIICDYVAHMEHHFRQIFHGNREK